jgi:hypothetical protein
VECFEFINFSKFIKCALGFGRNYKNKGGLWFCVAFYVAIFLYMKIMAAIAAMAAMIEMTSIA